VKSEPASEAGVTMKLGIVIGTFPVFSISNDSGSLVVSFRTSPKSTMGGCIARAPPLMFTRIGICWMLSPVLTMMSLANAPGLFEVART
jgi:hypothetical protein